MMRDDANFRYRPWSGLPRTVLWLSENADETETQGTYSIPSHLAAALDSVLDAEVREQTQAYWNRDDVPWRTVSTFDDLRRAMLRYICRQERISPWSAGPMADESDEIMGHLLQINDLGAITFGSQPGRDDHHGRQRAYLQLLVDDSYVFALHRAADFNGLVFASNPHQALEPQYGQYVVTEEPHRHGRTFAPVGIAYKVETVCPKIPAIDEVARSKTAVDLADTDWNTNRLFDIVITALREVRLGTTATD